MSDVALIEKLINFLKSSAVTPANQIVAGSPEANFTSALMAGDLLRRYVGTFGHWKYHLWEYCLIKVKLTELYAEFNFSYELLSENRVQLG